MSKSGSRTISNFSDCNNLKIYLFETEISSSEQIKIILDHHVGRP